MVYDNYLFYHGLENQPSPAKSSRSFYHFFLITKYNAFILHRFETRMLINGKLVDNDLCP